MGTAIINLPSPTPRLTQSLSPQEVEDHRARLAFEVEIVLQGYWQSQLSPEMKGAVLADWCDELEDWPQDQVRAALREWRSKNPSRKPNPGHVLEILKRWRGQSFAASRPVAQDAPREEPCSPEVAKEILRKAGFAVKRFDDPPTPYGDLRRKYPFPSMNVGDSFFAPFEGDSPDQQQNNIHNCARNFFGECGHVATRQAEENGVLGFKVWRVEKEPAK